MDARLHHLLEVFAHDRGPGSPAHNDHGGHSGGRGRDDHSGDEHEPTDPTGVIIVNDLVSKAASVYEVVRNAIEYSEAHLLRRNAIRRILRRRLFADEDPARVSRDLLHELIWARYLPNKHIPIERESEVAHILQKYVRLFAAVETDHLSSRASAWLLDLVSTEVEYLLTPPTKEEAMVLFAYHTLRTQTKWEGKLPIAEDEKDIQLYVGVHRTLLKSNQATLRYRIFLLFYPAWHAASDELVGEVAAGLEKVVAAIDHHVAHPMGETIARLLRQKMVLFKILHDVLEEEGERASTVCQDQAALAEAVKKVAGRRYKAFHARLWRLVLRAVFFLFCTKLILAFIIELPYQLFVVKERSYVPLLVNVLFHPFLLAALGLTGTIPEKKNTKLLIEGVRSLVFGGEGMKTTVTVSKPWARGFANVVFNLIYAATFVVSFGLIAAFLISLGFHVVSIILFLFFLSLVAFFGISIRSARKELLIVPGKGGFFSVLGDFFTLPIIRAGRWISMHAPRVNVFLFFLDFIVEAPFKLVIQVVEGWLAFMKEKKEEISA
ncbi:hypothetical protein HYW18_00380 [Candidatus Uhrbacteria bacterium]|nr:hypothetical protein [Candidatus Uhrbacteria bacterium]